jgi:hypothetical protein
MPRSEDTAHDALISGVGESRLRTILRACGRRLSWSEELVQFSARPLCHAHAPNRPVSRAIPQLLYKASQPSGAAGSASLPTRRFCMYEGIFPCSLGPVATTQRPWWRNPKVLAIGAITLVAATSAILVSARRPLSPLEQTLFSLVTLGLGVWASFVAGHEQGRQEAEARLRAQARSAFRRVVTLYGGHQRTVNLIQERLGYLLSTHATTGQIEAGRVTDAFLLVQAQVVEQGHTANDSIEDWRDLAPDEIEELEAALRKKLEHVV